MLRQTLSEYGMKMAQRIDCVDCGLYWYVSDDTGIMFNIQEISVHHYS
jgi:hypothetical protein